MATADTTPADDVAGAESGLPEPSSFAPIYATVCELAEELLDGPVQTEITTWEDGEFKIRVFHGYGPNSAGCGARLRTVLRYHSAEGQVDGAVLEVDAESGDETLIYSETVAELGARTPRS
jgi:hypothetical protein